MTDPSSFSSPIFPLVSVNMITYNSLGHLDKAILSVLNQTYSNFELIIVNADKNMISRLEYWKSKDSRIKLYYKEGLQVAPSRAFAVTLSSGKYIVIHDSDDYSDPKRFEKQVNYLESHPNVGCVGSYLRAIVDNSDHTILNIKYATFSFLIRFYSYFESPIGHGTSMLRKSVLDEHNINYRGHENGFPEDYYLFLQMLEYTDMACIPEYLYIYNCGVGNSCKGRTSVRLGILVPLIWRTFMYKRYGFIVNNKHFKRDIIKYIIKFSLKERLNIFQILIICASLSVFMLNSRVMKNRIAKMPK